MTDNEKIIIITGGNNGLGYFLGLSLLDMGHKVAILDLTIENGEKLKEKYPTRLLNFVCDVRSQVEIDKTVEDIIAKWGRIDVLINNAVIAVFKPFEEKELEETFNEFDINYFGYIRMIKSVLPQMKKQGGGIIHNLGSAVGIMGMKGIYGYSSTKGAIEALTRTLAMELEPYNIQVSLIHPPLMDTKSASPLGIPSQAVDDPEKIGNKIARKVFCKKPVITPDLKTAISLKMTYILANKLGKFLSDAAEAERARQQNADSLQK